jgi:hypothetical protein
MELVASSLRVVAKVILIVYSVYSKTLSSWSLDGSCRFRLSYFWRPTSDNLIVGTTIMQTHPNQWIDCLGCCIYIYETSSLCVVY